MNSDTARIGIQSKLKVSQPGDEYEQEADRVAEQVMRMLTSTVSNKEEEMDRKCAVCEMKEEEEKLNISRKTSNISGVNTSEEITTGINSVRSSDGSSLDSNTREFMESRFGYDFSDVRIHSSRGANESADSVNALAYTIGNDIVFAEGLFQPHTLEGRGLLAHELTHVLQQSNVHQQELMKGKPHLHNISDSMSLGRNMIFRKPAEPQLTVDMKQEWDDANGDAQILTPIRDASLAWEKKRASLRTYQDIRNAGQGLYNALDNLENLIVRTRERNFGRYVSVQLGGKLLRYMSEMASFGVPGAFKAGDYIPGISSTDPHHTYELTVQGKIGGVIDVITITYSNSLGVPGWSKVLRGLLFGISANITSSGEKPKGGTSVGPTSIEITGRALAQPVSLGYWGMDDLSGPIVTAKGPKGSFKVGGLGGEFESGGLITLVGSGAPGSLEFKDFNFKAKPISDTKKAKELKISISSPEEGAGYVITTPEETYEDRPLIPSVTEDSESWEVGVYGLETGSSGESSIEKEAVHRNIILPLKNKITFRQAQVEKDGELLQKLGKPAEFKLDFVVKGYASRRWTSEAKNDAKRRELNQQLSETRAKTVTSELYEAFGPDHSYSFYGLGSAVVSNPDETNPEIIPEMDDKKIAGILKQKEKDWEDKWDRMTPDDRKSYHSKEDFLRIQHLLFEADFGKISNVPAARAVEVKVTWIGYKVIWEPQNMSVEPSKD